MLVYSVVKMPKSLEDLELTKVTEILDSVFSTIGVSFDKENANNLYGLIVDIETVEDRFFLSVKRHKQKSWNKRWKNVLDSSFSEKNTNGWRLDVTDFFIISNPCDNLVATSDTRSESRIDENEAKNENNEAIKSDAPLQDYPDTSAATSIATSNSSVNDIDDEQSVSDTTQDTKISHETAPISLPNEKSGYVTAEKEKWLKSGISESLIKKYVNAKYDKDQIEEIRLGLLKEIDISLYDDPGRPWISMMSTRLFLERNLGS